MNYSQEQLLLHRQIPNTGIAAVHITYNTDTQLTYTSTYTFITTPKSHRKSARSELLQKPPPSIPRASEIISRRFVRVSRRMVRLLGFASRCPLYTDIFSTKYY